MPDSMANVLVRTVVWRNLVLRGTDLCSLSHTPEGWVLKGTVIGAIDEHGPIHTVYEISCDELWRTHRVEVTRTLRNETQTLGLTVESQGIWRSAGTELTSVKGCVDFDLGLSPATNTIPIRRLNLQIGESAAVTAAWAKFPDLKIQPLAQKYTRLAVDRYQYESATGFTAELVVDDLGLVVTYPQAWDRLASS